MKSVQFFLEKYFIFHFLVLDTYLLNKLCSWLSITMAVIELGKKNFAKGQVYVALSQIEYGFCIERLL